MAKKPPLVEAEWIDACDADDSGVRVADVSKVVHLAKRVTSGYLVFKDEEKTILAHDWDDGECGNFTCIPSGWVKRIRRIRGRR